jgi:hypothetical protein
MNIKNFELLSNKHSVLDNFTQQYVTCIHSLVFIYKFKVFNYKFNYINKHEF